MRTASTGLPSPVANSAFSVPSLALALVSTVSVDSGSSSASRSRRAAGTLVISSYELAPRAVHPQIWRARKGGSPASRNSWSSRSRSTGGECGRLDGVRLAKYLAHAGVASRRAAERLVKEGRVSVGGQVVTDPA